MKRRLIILLVIVIRFQSGQAQNVDTPRLFNGKDPIATHLRFSIKDVSDITNDTIYTPSQLMYQDEKGWDTLAISIRARGNFRRAKCFFPPIRIKISKKIGKGSLFQGSNNLKLVLQCHPAKSYSDLIFKEYLCYQLYQVVTPYFFKTRLVTVELTDISRSQPKTYSVMGFFIEDDDVAAKRFKGKALENRKMHPLQLHDTTSTIHDFFEYMIANTDWSSVEQHNIKLIQLDSKRYIPVAYDFDMAGLVNAPYATVSEKLEIESVRERVYRGFFRNTALLEFVRSEYLRLEPQIMETVNQSENVFSSKDFAGIKKYLEEFFTILRNDKTFDKNIVQMCQGK